jgi:hypothetical protein
MLPNHTSGVGDITGEATPEALKMQHDAVCMLSKLAVVIRRENSCIL